MIVDARRHDGSTLRTDVCVVGGGAAGIAMAQRLIGTGIDVVVLESGGDEYHSDTQQLYGGEQGGLPYFDLAAARLRYFGGSTNHWGGTCRPLAAQDFDPQPGVPLSGWPIGLDDVAPYYAEAGTICGLRRPVDEMEDARFEDDERPLPLDTERFETRFNQIVRRRERSFAERYRAALDAAPNVAVHLWANVVEVLTTGAGRAATGVSVATLSGVRYTVEAGAVVLAVGGIENARLMLASTGEDPAGVGNRHDQVGRYFMEHPRFVAARVTPADAGVSLRWYQDHNVGRATFKGYHALTPALEAEAGIADVQLRLGPVLSDSFERALASDDARSAKALVEWFDGKRDRLLGADLLRVSADLATFGDWFVPGGPVPVPVPGVLRRILNGSKAQRAALVPGLFGNTAAYLWEKGIGDPPIEAIEVSARSAQVPNPESRITLAQEVDALGMPRARLDWRLTDLDRRSIVETVERFGAELAAAGVGRLQMLVDEDGDWPSDLAGGWHHMGTTRMSGDPATGVVDRNCRVHGVDNLYVAGSSVFATAGSGTPTLTLVALALRLADHLIEEVRR